MTQTGDGGAVVCEACGKRYAFKPQYAGKRLKCKCGAVIEMPAAAATEEDEGEFDLAPTADAFPSPPPRAAPPPPRPSPSAGPRVPQRRPAAAKVDAHAQAERQKVKTMAMVLVGVGLVVALAIAGLKFAGGGGAGVDPNAKGEDAYARQKIRDDGMVPAAEWLASGPPGKMLGGFTTKQAEYRIQDWKKMGAKEVLIANTPMSMVAILELPDDPAQRKALYDWQAKWHAERTNTEVRKDQGGKYLSIDIPIGVVN